MSQISNALKYAFSKTYKQLKKNVYINNDKDNLPVAIIQFESVNSKVSFLSDLSKRESPSPVNAGSNMHL